MTETIKTEGYLHISTIILPILITFLRAHYGLGLCEFDI